MDDNKLIWSETSKWPTIFSVYTRRGWHVYYVLDLARRGYIAKWILIPVENNQWRSVETDEDYDNRD